MTVAFVFINTEMGAERAVLRAIKKVRGVEEVQLVYGTYDIVAKIAADTMDELRQIVIHRIRRIDKVLTTLTATAVEDWASAPAVADALNAPATSSADKAGRLLIVAHDSFLGADLNGFVTQKTNMGWTVSLVGTSTGN